MIFALPALVRRLQWARLMEINAQVIDELNPGLFRFAMRFVRATAEAEDLVQDTWLSALRSAPTFEGRSSLRTWLNGILRRRAVDRHRKSRDMLELDDDLAGSDIESASDHLDSAHAARLIMQSMAQLSAGEHHAVTLCDLEDCDRDEAAARMDITRGHLRVLLHRGRQKIVAQLEAQGVSRRSSES